MLEDIRIVVTKRLASNKILVDKWISESSPECMDIFQENRCIACGCNMIFNGDSGYEVSNRPDRHTVFLNERLCICKAWDLTVILCSHVICALTHA